MKSEFSLKRGFDLSQNSMGMTYLYGLSDFWAVMFEDSAQIDHLLQVTTFQLSEIYSKFLQRCSYLSLDTIQASTHQQKKLLIISEQDRVPGDFPYVYSIPKDLLSCAYIANRPFLPTRSLSQGIHFDVSADNHTIRFYDKLENLGFPSRKNSSGVEEYSLWAADAEVDEQLVFNNYGKLLDVTPETSSDLFKSFVEGLFYVYAHGPVIDAMIYGFNVSIGIPLARGGEQVLSITRYLNSDNYMVITDLNSYVIPYGLIPTVGVGDNLEVGQQMSTWVEVKDYKKDGDWWVNLNIPEKFIPDLPEGVTDRFATPGSYTDYVMRNYLKTHTFLVNITVTYFQSAQIFGQISSLMNGVKPSYTCPVYIWSTESVDELVVDEDVAISTDYMLEDPVMLDIREFNRSNEDQVFTRGKPYFFRYQTWPDVDKWLGRGEVYDIPEYEYEGEKVGRGLGAPNNKYYCQPIHQTWFSSEEGPNPGFDQGNVYRSQVTSQGIELKPDYQEGSWTSPDIKLSEIQEYHSSFIAVTFLNGAEDGSKVVTEMSFNDGPWITVQNRRALPEFSQGEDYAQDFIKFRLTLTRKADDTSPVVTQVSFRIEPPINLHRGHSDHESAWFRTLWNRANVAATAHRGQPSMQRGLLAPAEHAQHGEPVSVVKQPITSIYKSKAINTVPVNGGASTSIYLDTSTVPLYVAHRLDIMDKLIELGYRPELYDNFVLNGINILDNYESLFFRGPKGKPRNIGLPQSLADYSFAPDIEDVTNEDAIFVSRVLTDTYAVFWATNKPSVNYKPYAIGPAPDHLKISLVGDLNYVTMPTGPYTQQALAMERIFEGKMTNELTSNESCTFYA